MGHPGDLSSERDWTARTAGSETTTMGPKAILVADHEKMVLEVRREMLERLGLFHRIWPIVTGSILQFQ